jgi:hypothetical protein
MDGDFREDSEELRKAFVRCSVVSRLTCAFVAACAVVPVPVVGIWSPQVPIARIVCVFKKDGSETWKLVRLWVGSFTAGTAKLRGDSPVQRRFKIDARLRRSVRRRAGSRGWNLEPPSADREDCVCHQERWVGNMETRTSLGWIVCSRDSEAMWRWCGVVPRVTCVFVAACALVPIPVGGMSESPKCRSREKYVSSRKALPKEFTRNRKNSSICGRRGLRRILDSSSHCKTGSECEQAQRFSSL